MTTSSREPAEAVFEMIADERRTFADLAEGLTEAQLQQPSLVPTWAVRDVVAHVVVGLEVSLPRMAIAFLLARGNFDRAIDSVTWKLAKRPVRELAGILRAKATDRFTPPGAGPEAPLTDLIIHGLDLRRPLGIARDIPERRARVVLETLVRVPPGPLVREGWREGLRFEATNFEWAHGEGPVLRGHSDALMLAITGRVPALDDLQGDGAAELRRRFGSR